MYKNNETLPKNKNSKLKKGTVAGVGLGVGLLALVSSYKVGQESTSRPSDRVAVAEATGKPAATGAEIVANEISYNWPIMFLNGSLVETQANGKIKVYPSPIIEYTGDPHTDGPLDPKNYRYFTAIHKDGVPTVTEITTDGSFQINRPEDESEPLTVEAILEPLRYPVGPDEADAFGYGVKSFPEDLATGQTTTKLKTTYIGLPFVTELAPN